MKNFPSYWSKFKSDWIADAMQWGKMNRAEAEDCWDKQEYRDSETIGPDPSGSGFRDRDRDRDQSGFGIGVGVYIHIYTYIYTYTHIHTYMRVLFLVFRIAFFVCLFAFRY